MLLENANIYLDYEAGKQSMDKYVLSINYRCNSCKIYRSLRKTDMTWKEAVSKVNAEEAFS